MGTEPETELPSRLAAPARRALVAAGSVRLEQLAQVREREVMQLHGMGPAAMAVLGEALMERGLAFRRD